MAAVERRWRAMGCEARVLLVGATERLGDEAVRRVDDLEARWSRFRGRSEISRLNARPGVPVIVSEETFALVERAVIAWESTGGRFDPTVHDAVVAAGYDRSFELVEPRHEPPGTATVVPGCAGIVLDATVGAVTLPGGVRLDPGGIGKGYAGDLLAAELLAAGAEGVLVDLGGDLRVAGEPPDGEAWVVAVEHPFDESREVARLALADGAVATSSRRFRRWSVGGHEVHHLVDPRTGSPVEGDVVAVTVVSAEGWWAEALTKAAFVAGVDDGRALVAVLGATGLLVSASGEVVEVDGLEELAA